VGSRRSGLGGDHSTSTSGGGGTCCTCDGDSKAVGSGQSEGWVWLTRENGGGLVSHAVGRCWDPGNVRHGRDRAKRLWGLSVGADDAVRAGVNTGEVLVITIAAQEEIVDVSSRGVILASNSVENVLAEVGSVGACRVTSLQAEDTRAHEVVPFNDLFVIGSAPGEVVAEEKASKRVATSISTVRVHLSSSVIRGHVDEVLLDETGDLDVVGGLHELKAGDGTGGDDTSTMAGLGAPRNHGALDVTNSLVGSRGCPQAEVVDRIDEGGLTVGCWSFGGGVTDVVTELEATFTTVGVSVIRESGVSEVLAGEWEGTGALGGDGAGEDSGSGDE